MSKSYTSSPPSASMACSGTALLFHIYNSKYRKLVANHYLVSISLNSVRIRGFLSLTKRIHGQQLQIRPNTLLQTFITQDHLPIPIDTNQHMPLKQHRSVTYELSACLDINLLRLHNARLYEVHFCSVLIRLFKIMK
jgi:hypothetical protein